MSSRRSTGRLPSFKGKRDLTLGAGTGGRSIGNSAVAAAAKLTGKRPGSMVSAAGVSASGSGEKKKFVPNLNVGRKQNTGAPTTTSAEAKKTEVKSGWGSEKKSDNPTARKPRQEFIQTMGSVFAEGFGSDGIRRFGKGRGGGGGGSGGREIEKPKINLDFKIDKEAEAKRLKELLRDDFIDDLSTGPLVPVQLPMIDTGTLFQKEKQELKKEESSDDDDKVVGVKKSKKPSILDSDDDEDDIKDSKKAVIDGKKICGGTQIRNQIKMTDLIQAQKGDLFFLQLPDHLPGIANLPDSDSLQNLEGEVQAKCQLSDLPEGYLGKIQVRKSGKTQLVLGPENHCLDMDLGTQVGFLQDLVSVKIPQASEGKDEDQVPELTVLGHVRHRAVLAPDWSKLFDSAKAEASSSDEDEL